MNFSTFSVRRALTGAILTIAACNAFSNDAVKPVSAKAEVVKPDLVKGQASFATCAACHGANLEGQPDWRIRLANGRLPGPPHDDTGHTWHHPDEVLFGIVKNGLVPPYAPADYPSDMPAFRSILTDDDIQAVLAFIESRWSSEVMKMRKEMINPRQSPSRSMR